MVWEARVKPHLYIGNPNYSSWSLRAWLVLRWAGIDFDETIIDLDQPGYGASQIAGVLAVSPTGKVPALRTSEGTVWDTLGIALWAIENGDRHALVPDDAPQRAVLWSAVGEMHAGFSAVRRDLSMNILRRCKAYGLPDDTRADIARIDQLWADLRSRFGEGGPYLLGARSLADAFYLPVATRFRTYGVPLSPAAQAYVEAALSDADFLYWETRLRDGPPPRFSRANIDGLFPDQAPGGAQ